MSNMYPFGQWIIGDLGLVGLGGGAFTTGFLLYIFRNDKLEPLINSTVLIGFMCYLFTLVFLVFDIGQPLRAWFGYTYPNWGPHLMPTSMLTEVVWCLTFYFMILCVELDPGRAEAQGTRRDTGPEIYRPLPSPAHVDLRRGRHLPFVLPPGIPGRRDVGHHVRQRPPGSGRTIFISSWSSSAQRPAEPPS